jgi:GDPmannose 4,6-dehydratase
LKYNQGSYVKKALICGISGQDGAYLSQLLLNKGYQVIGTSRDTKASNFSHLDNMGISKHIEFVAMAINDFRSVLNVFDKIKPDEVYNLAGQSSVGLSFEQPVETLESINIGTLNLLEAIRFLNLNSRLYNAGSSECFGESTEQQPANEQSCFLPRSPYAVAKASAHWLIANYREAYNIYACTGHLFNHESPCRGENFVTKKVISSVVNIAQKKQQKLHLGNLDIVRDWGWAPEYVEAMWLMLQQDKADDYVIATGRSVSLRYFVEQAFAYFNLDMEQYLVQNNAFLRPTELRCSYADPEKACKLLKWKAQYDIDDVVKMMIDDELK